MRRKLSPVVEGWVGLAVALIITVLATASAWMRVSPASVIASAAVLVWAGWIARDSWTRIGR